MVSISKKCILCYEKSFESSDINRIYCDLCREKLSKYGLEDTLPNNFYPEFLLNLCCGCFTGDVSKDKFEKVVLGFERFYKDKLEIFKDIGEVDKEYDENLFEAKTNLYSAFKKYLEGLELLKEYLLKGDVDFITQGLIKTKDGHVLYKQAMMNKADSTFHWYKILSDAGNPLFFDNSKQ